MRARIASIVGLALALGLGGCGDEPEESESAACRSFLDAVAQCMDDWCAGDGAGNAYCNCYDDGRALQTNCECAGAGSWREAHRQIHCSQDLEGMTFDCEGTKEVLAEQVASSCG